MRPVPRRARCLAVVTGAAVAWSLAGAPSVLALPGPGQACVMVGVTVTFESAQLTCSKTPTGYFWTAVASGPVYQVEELGELASCAADPTAVRAGSKARVYFATSSEGPCRAYAGDVQQDSLLAPLRSGAGRLDPGVRFEINEVGPHKRVLRLPDGRYRMFVQTPRTAAVQGLGSAISSDGITFSLEAGVRVRAKDARIPGHAALSPGDVVRTKDGRYRMYFSSFDLQPTGPDVMHVVKSAISSDLIHWKVEHGDRIGGSATLDESGEHPSAVTLPDGSTVLFYGRRLDKSGRDASGLYYSWSADGVTFSTERLLLPGVLDSAFIRLPDGTLSGFFGRRDNEAERSYIDRVQLTPSSGTTS
jgi:hypothetical protein